MFPPDIMHVSPIRGPAAATGSNHLAPDGGDKSEPLVTHSRVLSGISPPDHYDEFSLHTEEREEAIPAPHRRRDIRPAWQFKGDLRT